MPKHFLFFFLNPADSAIYLPFLWRAEINRYTMSQHLIREVQQLKQEVAKLLEERNREDHLREEILDLKKRVRNLETYMTTRDL